MSEDIVHVSAALSDSVWVGATSEEHVRKCRSHCVLRHECKWWFEGNCKCEYECR